MDCQCKLLAHSDLPTSTCTYQSLTSEVPQIVPNDKRGTVLAIEAALYGLCGMLMPELGAFLFSRLGFPAIGATGSLCVLLMVCLVHLRVVMLST